LFDLRKTIPDRLFGGARGAQPAFARSGRGAGGFRPLAGDPPADVAQRGALLHDDRIAVAELGGTRGQLPLDVGFLILKRKEERRARPSGGGAAVAASFRAAFETGRDGLRARQLG